MTYNVLVGRYSLLNQSIHATYVSTNFTEESSNGVTTPRLDYCNSVVVAGQHWRRRVQ